MLWYKLRQIPNIVVDSVVFSLSEAIAKELRKICILLQLLFTSVGKIQET